MSTPMDGRLNGFREEGEGDGAPPRSPRARMSPGPASYQRIDGRSMVDLLRELSSESGNLVRQEVELAKAEMREKMTVYTRGMVTMAIGGALLLAALLTALWALNTGLTSLLTQVMGLDLAIWLSPLILTLALAGIGWTLIRGARERMTHEGLMPRRTRETLREDRLWAESKAHEIKEGVSHGR